MGATLALLVAVGVPLGLWMTDRAAAAEAAAEDREALQAAIELAADANEAFDAAATIANAHLESVTASVSTTAEARSSHKANTPAPRASTRSGGSSSGGGQSYACMKYGLYGTYIGWCTR